MFIEVTQKKNHTTKPQYLKRMVNINHVVLVQPISHCTDCEIVLAGQLRVDLLNTIVVQETYEQVKSMIKQATKG